MSQFCFWFVVLEILSKKESTKTRPFLKNFPFVPKKSCYIKRDDTNLSFTPKFNLSGLRKTNESFYVACDVTVITSIFIRPKLWEEDEEVLSLMIVNPAFLD